MYDQLPLIRAKRLESVLRLWDNGNDQGDWRQLEVETKTEDTEEAQYGTESKWKQRLDHKKERSVVGEKVRHSINY